MGIREELYKALNDGLPQLDTRIFPLHMPQDTAQNSLVYVVYGDRENAGYCGVKVASDLSIQIDCYAKTYAEAASLKDNTISVLRGAFNVANLNTYEMYEDITLKYRQSIDFRLNDYDK